ncbi:TadE/TadG family type IV pilus assembly protein [Methylobacterium durans]|uniref:TadE/TadG family type IV pilus assembly protein n=1 Tax=Methylobacterium durans TaxID=2202825 RepID=UPI002AFFA902|nr:TadE/TadG family type IV pilus assembly protein [Methylobacterium durans]MEA1834044.1 TadE/TadG family type IV pilus assembly protein [Methylobacterium durans]
MFADDRRGSIAVILAIALPVLLVGAGGSIEASRAVSYRHRLASAVELTCTQGQAFLTMRRAADFEAGTLTRDYQREIDEIAARNFAAKDLGGVKAVTRPTYTNLHVEARATLPLILGRILRTDNITVAASRDCPVELAASSGKPEVLISESFERPSHGVNYNTWGVLGTVWNGRAWNGWTTQAGGIEINGQRELASNSIRFGDFFAELDSDCEYWWVARGSPDCHSNSTMSRILNLTQGDYQVRYWYIARLRDPARPGQIICGAKGSDVNWYQVDGQTNRIEVYVEKSGQYTLQPANIVDVCVQADSWTERVVNFTVKDASEYRISWRAAGREDTYGGLIDYLRICRNACPL